MTRFHTQHLTNRSNLSYLGSSSNSNDLRSPCLEDTMRIAILGTGRVAQTLAAALVGAGHDVVIGSRDPANRSGLPAKVARLGRCRRRRRRRAQRSTGRRHDPAAHIDRRRQPRRHRAVGHRQRSQPRLLTHDPRRQPRPTHPASLPGRQGRQGSQQRRRRGGRRPDHAARTNDTVPLRRPHRRQGGRLWPAHRPRLATRSLFDLGGIANAYGQEHYLALFGTILHKLGTPYFNIAIVKAA